MAFRIKLSIRSLAIASIVCCASVTAVSVPAEAWNSWDVGDLRRVSTRPGGDEAFGRSSEPVMSANGRFVVFFSRASLLPGLKANGNVFRRNIATGHLELVSTNATGVPAKGSSFDPDVSSDGRLVTFTSRAKNLTADDPDRPSVFVKNMGTGRVELVSKSSEDTPANAAAYNPSISPNGSRVVFESYASNLTDHEDNGWSDTFVYNRDSDALRLVSADVSGESTNHDSFGAVLANKGRILFASLASDLSAQDTDTCADLFVRRTDGTLRLIDVGCTALARGSWTMSADGRVIAFGRRILVLPSNNQWVSRKNGDVVSLSTTGRYAAFETGASLVPRDTNGIRDIYVKDLRSGDWRLATVSSDGDIARESSPYGSSLSGDASFLAFASGRTDLIEEDRNFRHDVFVKRLK